MDGSLLWDGNTARIARLRDAGFERSVSCHGPGGAGGYFIGRPCYSHLEEDMEWLVWKR